MKKNPIYSVILAILLVFCPVCCAMEVVNATAGDTVTLPCFTELPDPVDWKYQSHETVDDIFIFVAGNRGSYWPHHSRTQLIVEDGDYNLTIDSVTVNDTGMYTCIEDMGVGAKHLFWLQVYDPGQRFVTILIGATVAAVVVLMAVLVTVIVVIIRRKRRQNGDADEQIRLKSMSEEHRQLLEQAKANLSDIMDPTSELLEELIRKKILKRNDKRRINGLQQCDEKVLAIIDILMHKSDAVFRKFIDALCAVKQEDVASLLGHEMKQMTDEHLELIKNNTEELIHFIDPTDALFNCLVNKGALSNRDATRVTSKQNREEKSREVINILLGKPDSVFDRFIEALRDSDHDHVAFILTGKGEQPLSLERRKVLQRVLKSSPFDSIDLSDATLIGQLLSAGVINSNDDKQMDAEHNVKDKNAVFIDAISRKSDKTFDKLIDALKDRSSCKVRKRQKQCKEIVNGYELPDDIELGKFQDGVTPMSYEHCQLLNDKRKELIQFIDPSDKLLNCLLEMEAFAVRDTQQVAKLSSYDQKSKKVIKILLLKPDTAFDKFIKALRKSNQDHVAYILTGKGELPLSPVRRRVLQEADEYLLNSSLSTEATFINKLLSAGVINDNDKKLIDAEQTLRDKNAALVDAISRKSEKTYDKLIQALKYGNNSEVAEYLENKYLEISRELRYLEVAENLEEIEREIHTEEAEATLKRIQADVEECMRLQKQDLGAFRLFLQKKEEEWKIIQINIAIIGNSGIGKSSFINAIRGLTVEETGAAPIEVHEQTRKINCYSHPDYPRIKFWDLPGVGTAQFPKDTYLRRINVDRYDFFLLLSDFRQHSETNKDKKIDSWLAWNITQRDKKFYYVRTKVDLKGGGVGESHEELLEKCRHDIDCNLKELGCAVDTKVFFIDNYHTDKYDFERLKNSLIKDIPVLRDISVMAKMQQEAELNKQREQRRTNEKPKQAEGGCIVS